MDVVIIIISSTIFLTPLLGFFWICAIEKENQKLNPKLYYVRWSRTFFWFTAALGCIPFGAIIFAFIELKYPVNIYGALFFLLPLLIAVFFCYYSLCKRVLVDSETKTLKYYTVFKKVRLIKFVDIDKIFENQHSFSIYILGNTKNIYWETPKNFCRLAMNI